METYIQAKQTPNGTRYDVNYADGSCDNAMSWDYARQAIEKEKTKNLPSELYWNGGRELVRVKHVSDGWILWSETKQVRLGKYTSGRKARIALALEQA